MSPRLRPAKRATVKRRTIRLSPLPPIFDPNWRMRLQMQVLLTYLPQNHPARWQVYSGYAQLLAVAAGGGKMVVLTEKQTGLGVGRARIHA